MIRKTGALRVLLPTAALSLLFLWIDSGVFLHETLSRGQTFGRDFASFWTASTLVWRGEALTLFDPATYQTALDQIMGSNLAFMPFPYPPSALFYLLPLGVLPYGWALVLWLAVTIALLAFLLRRQLTPAWLGLLLLAPASAVNISTGQNGFLSAALLCGGLLVLEKRPILAGMLFGLLSYKPQLGLIVPLLLIAGGYWRTFIAAGATVALLVIGSALIFGSEAWLLFLEKTGPQQLAFMQSGTGRFQAMTPSFFMTARLAGMPTWTGWLLQALSALAAIVGTLLAWRRDIPPRMKAAIAMVAAFMISPYVLSYDMVILAVAMALAIPMLGGRWWSWGVLLLSWTAPISMLFVPTWLGPVSTSLLFLLLLWRSANPDIEAPALVGQE
ncbi:glycosyltransferase family 87 protein [Dongia sp.]|uniref:glycosyltransferase family 87 protein n=1 Tax=Dongia sp. TaxID=1977262 RepID=UPI0035B4E05D